MADCSKHGWNTVTHYQEDPLASDPEDDKEIKSPENKAEKDVKREAEKAQKTVMVEVDEGSECNHTPKGVSIRLPDIATGGSSGEFSSTSEALQTKALALFSVWWLWSLGQA